MLVDHVFRSQSTTLACSLFAFCRLQIQEATLVVNAKVSSSIAESKVFLEPYRLIDCWLSGKPHLMERHAALNSLCAKIGCTLPSRRAGTSRSVLATEKTTRSSARKRWRIVKHPRARPSKTNLTSSTLSVGRSISPSCPSSEVKDRYVDEVEISTLKAGGM